MYLEYRYDGIGVSPDIREGIVTKALKSTFHGSIHTLRLKANV